MASAAVHIANMREAIASQVVPGAFSADRTTFAFPTLAYAGARGATHFWTIRVRLLVGSEYVPITDQMLDQPAAALAAGARAEVIVESKQAQGKVRDIIPTYVSIGKNLGKKNATNAITQAIRDALGLFNKQKKRTDTVEADTVADTVEAADEAADDSVEAMVAAENASLDPQFDSMPPPMLVKKIGDSREATLTAADWTSGITAQRKLNGVRFVVFMRNGKLVRYSRTGTEYPGQEQVVAEMAPMMTRCPQVTSGQYGLAAVPAGARDQRILAAYGEDPCPYFDGELFYSGKSLSWISGQARKGDDAGILQFHIFDVFFPYAKAAGHDMESRHRQAYIDAFFSANDNTPHPHVVRVENFHVKTPHELETLSKQFLKEGYEGLIARKDNAGYRYGYNNYHSANLLKIKPKFDDEFPVVGFNQGIRGKDVGAIIWECEVPNPVDPNDKTFAVVPKDMTYDQRYSLFKCLSELVPRPDGKKITRFERDIKGLPLTVEYAEVSSKTGKPLQAKAVAFRTYEGGPDADPIRKLLNECLPAKK